MERGTEFGNEKELLNYTRYLELRVPSQNLYVVFETGIKNAILILFRMGEGYAAYSVGCAAYAVGCAAYAAGCAAYVRQSENKTNSVQLSWSWD